MDVRGPGTSVIRVVALAIGWMMASPVANGLSHLPAMTGAVQAESVPAELTLSDQRTEGSFAIPPHVVKEPPPVLGLRVTKVVNPGNTAFQILIYLSAGAGPEKDPAAGRIPLGNVALYPADRPGAFLLRDTAAFNKLKASMPKAKEGSARLVVEIRRLHKDKEWTHVELTFVPPEWISEPGK